MVERLQNKRRYLYMAGSKKEELESKNAIAEVKKADEKVEELRAKKAAAIAAKDAEILEKHPKIGSKINWVRHNKWKLVAGAATSGASFAAGWFAHKFFGKKDDEPAIEAETTPIEESTEPPFEA
jgi:hypothetical protein